MAITTPPAARGPAPRQRKPLQPVAVRVEHLAYNHGLGLGTLDIASADGQRVETYILSAHRDGQRLLGMRLTKLASGESHDVGFGTKPWRCDCGDATNRPERPGGCKHIVVLRQAAAKLRQQS